MAATGSMRLETGALLGPYKIVAPIGAGGMGEVYRATDTRLDRSVAIKVLPESVAKDPAALKRFDREAKAAAALSHPNILALFDTGDSGGVHFTVTELLDGETLRVALQKGPIGVRRALAIAEQIAQGLAAAHDSGITHRDIKPENLFITTDGRAKILDFGLARRSGPASPNEATQQMLSAEGVVLGTVPYMSPEQARGEAADFRSDQFALGTVLYELLTGVRPFQGSSPAETLTAIIREDPVPLDSKAPTVPAPVRWTVERCLAKEPRGRYASTRDLAAELRTLTLRLSDLATAPRGVPAAAFASRSDAVSGAAGAAAGRGQTGWRAAGLAAALLAAAGVGFALAQAVRQAAEKEPFSLQTISFRSGMIWSGRFALDGQTILYSAAWDGEPVRTFATQPGNAEGRPLDLPSSKILSISSSGEIAFLRDPEFVFFFYQPGTLARAPLAGGTPRDLLEGVTAADWLPGRDELVVARQAGASTVLELPLGKRVFETEGPIHSLRVSSDGKRAAFFHTKAGSSSVAIASVSGEVRELSKGWDVSSSGLAFSTDGKEVWFTASRVRTEAPALRAVSLSGQEREVYRAPGGLHLLDVHRDGRVLFTESTMRVGLRGATPTSGGEREWSWLDQCFLQDLSRDGGAVAFTSWSTTYLRRTDGTPAVRIGHEGLIDARLSPDGSRLLFEGQPRSRILVVPAGAGENRELAVADVVQTDWFPDGRRIAYAVVSKGKTALFTVDDELGKSESVPLTAELSSSSCSGLAVSSDGSRLALRVGDGNEFWTIGTKGESPQRVRGSLDNRQFVGWGPDEKSFLVYRIGEVPARVERIDLESGEATLWKELGPPEREGLVRVHPVRVTPDGRSYAYSYTRVLSKLFLAKGLPRR